MRILLCYRRAPVPATRDQPDTEPLPTPQEPDIVWDTRDGLEDDPLPASVLVARYPKVVVGQWYPLEVFKSLCSSDERAEVGVWMDFPVRLVGEPEDLWVEIRSRQDLLVDSIVSEVIAFASAISDGREWSIRVE